MRTETANVLDAFTLRKHRQAVVVIVYTLPYLTLPYLTVPYRTVPYRSEAQRITKKEMLKKITESQGENLQDQRITKNLGVLVTL